jgi:hypothetical protein
VENQTVAALIIGKVSIAPLVFVKTGDYLDKNGKQKQAFANGMVYFRHGAKSEPCTSDDLQRFIACEVDNLRNSWLSNIRKVVEAPDGAQIIVLQDNQISSRNDNIQNIRLVDDPDAPAHQLLDINKTHPYRTKDIVELVNKYLGNQDKITTHTIISIKHVHNIDKIRRFYYRPHHGTASYSQAFVEWLIEQFEKDNTFFSVAKEKYRDVVVKQNMKRKLLEKKS